MSTVTIAHLSDLHFASWKDRSVWQQVCRFINEDVQPHLVLVTGDVTDNATYEEFQEAERSLEMLRRHPNGDPLTYRIIPGNHDRFILKGNTWFSLGKTRFAKDKAGRFTSTFEARTVTKKPCDLDLPTDDPMWHPRIIGIDSNDGDKCFAQGFVSDGAIADAVSAARGGSERDLVIALVHHHVLPIPELEAERSGVGIAQLANVTGLLNSGTLLNCLSRAHVDLVLHGHEHKRYQARFSSVDEDASNVVVLAAGSGTGAETRQNFSLKRVHFNILELQADRSVRLREVELADDGVLAYKDPPRRLLSAGEVRRSRFIRKHGKKSGAAGNVGQTPRSSLKKLVRFSEQRDIEVTETRTEWVVGGPWTLFSTNSSGQLGPLVVECQWAPRVTQSYLAEFLQKRDEPNFFVATVPLVEGAARKAERITSTWTWHGGAVLTSEDVDLIRARVSDRIRLAGREYTSIRTSQELESLSITVQLPFRFAPNPEDVDVRVRDLAKPEKDPKLSNELRLGLEFCGRSIIELRVPYPLPNHVYYVTWPVATLSSANPETDLFCSAARKITDELIAAATSVLSRRIPPEGLRVGLYSANGSNGSSVDRLGGGDSPSVISLSTPRGLPRIAWWGTTAVAERDLGAADDADRDFCDDEHILAIAPVRGSDDSGMAAVGLIRLGLRRSLKGLVTLQELTALLADAASAVLSIARREY